MFAGEKTGKIGGKTKRKKEKNNTIKHPTERDG